MNLLLVGNGKFGQNYINTCKELDINLSIADKSNWKQLINAKPDGAFVVTQPEYHIDIAEYALSKDIPTMIEKPVALSAKDLNRLKQYESKVFVNYIHLHSMAFKLLKYHFEDTDSVDKIFTLGYNSGPLRSYSSLWDYGCHDLAMILDIAKGFHGKDTYPKSLHIEKINTETGELFNLRLYFDTFETESLIGNGGKHSVRKLKIHSGGLKYIYDDKMRPATHKAPLYNAIEDFTSSIRHNIPHSLDLSFKITDILEKCDLALKGNGNIDI